MSAHKDFDNLAFSRESLHDDHGNDHTGRPGDSTQLPDQNLSSDVPVFSSESHDEENCVTGTARYTASNNDNGTAGNTGKAGSTGTVGNASDTTSTLTHAQSHVDFNVPSPRRRASGERPRSASSDVHSGPYRGMGKEELLRYSSKPFWRNLRYVCMSVVLTGWLALLITVVALVLTYPQCRQPQDQEWWQKAVVYRVYVPSFLDASGEDGKGDIKGVHEKLEYIKSIGANTLSLSPFYKRAVNASSDTEIVDHMDVDPSMGSLDDVRRLINATHEMGMHVTVDFIPNHTSDQHEWFVWSSANSSRENNYRSYYVWQEADNGGPINDWQSVDGCSAWHFPESEPDNSSHMYLAQFTRSQPDLNLRSDKVKDELRKILEFWLNMGVDGFYIRDADFLFEDYDLRDEMNGRGSEAPAGKDCNDNQWNVSSYESLSHIYTRGATQNLDMLAHWRATLDQVYNTTGRYRILLADVRGPRDHVMTYYGLFNRDGADFPLNTDSLKLKKTSGGQGLAEMVSGWMENLPAGRWANWMTGDERSPRLADRLDDALAKCYMMVVMLLPGTPIVFYGDEIGMQGVMPPSGASSGSRARDMRAPMLWDNQRHTNNGFCHKQRHCDKEPWIPTRDLGNDTHFDAESQSRDSGSMLNLFKNLTSLRQASPSLQYGDFTTAAQDKEVFAFIRDFDGETGYLVAVNLGSVSASRRFTASSHTVPGEATVEVTTGPILHRGNTVDLDPLTLAPGEGVVVSWDYEAKEL